MAIEEVSEWRKAGRIPVGFSGRAPDYQTWVELLQEIDTNPVDTDRLKAMKAMFLAANDIKCNEWGKRAGVSAIPDCQAPRFRGTPVIDSHLPKLRIRGWKRDYQSGNASNWRTMIAKKWDTACPRWWNKTNER
jgi:hypothetical protein